MRITKKQWHLLMKHAPYVLCDDHHPEFRNRKWIFTNGLIVSEYMPRYGEWLWFFSGNDSKLTEMLK